MVFGLSVLQNKKVKIDFIDRIWRFGIDKYTFILEISDKFAQSLKRESTVYTIVVINIEFYTINLKNIEITPTFFSKYIVYADIFSTENASLFLFYKIKNHVIDLDGGESPYNFLYNLLIIEF